MAVEHIVYIKFKPGTTNEQIQQVHDGLLSLTKIDGVISIRGGINFTTRADFHYGFIVTLADKQALDRYINDADHCKIRDELIVPIKENIIALDFDTTAPLQAKI